MRVLICDDEADIRMVYRIAFEDLGAEVTEAVDGDDCIERITGFCPDLVILDIYMPNRDGLSALPELKRLCPHAHVLVVSAHDGAETLARSRARGATACFEKLNFISRIPRVVERYGGAT